MKQSFENVECFSSLDKATNKVKEGDEGCTVMEITEDAIQIQKVEVPEFATYIYLKFRLLSARCLKATNKAIEAHSECTQIIMQVKQCQELTPSKYWLTAVKAAGIVSTQFCNAREFNEGLVYLEKVAMPIVEKVGDYFLPSEKKDESKVLQDSHYTFVYRKFIS